MNKLFISGNLTAEPVLSKREFADPETGEIIKVNVCNFPVAVNDGYGSRKTTTYFSVTAWRNLGETVAKFLHKGSGVLVVGPVRNNNYVDKHGNLRTKMEIRADDIQFFGKRVDSIPEMVESTFESDVVENQDDEEEALF